MSLILHLHLHRRSLILSLVFFHNILLIVALTHTNTNNNHTHLLRDIIKEISTKQKWDLSNFRDLKLQLDKVRFAAGQREDFRVKLGKKRELSIKIPEEVNSWKKLITKNGNADFGSVVREIGSMGVIESFKIEGPCELRISHDEAIDRLSLSLPRNSSHIGLRRILVREGITMEVEGAQEISLYYSSDLGFHENKSDVIHESSPYSQSFCLPLVPIRIKASASIVAYRTQNHESYIKTKFLSTENDVIELLPDKCYSDHSKKKWSFPIMNLSSRIPMLPRVLKGLIGDRDRVLFSLKANIRASAIIRFQLELERNIGSRNVTLHEGAWRTRAVVERSWYDVTCRVESGQLKPLVMKKVRPFVGVDSVAWSSIMSNISFTKFPSILVPPEALTLDVKW